ncbi:MAG: hypothetical protein LW860_07015 [Xanthomonadaceae bacterium]|jgi:hypothetical protein|nr:hypothetical protein [Xanthomonadaceae bacterium]
MATVQTTAPADRFNRYWRAVGAYDLVLVREDTAGEVLEWVELDIRTLPDRHDLLVRMSEIGRKHLLEQALAERDAA